MREVWQGFRGLPSWVQWVIGVVAAVLVIALLAPSDDSADDEQNTVTVTASAPPAEPARTEPAQTIADANAAADAGDYAKAVEIATAIGQPDQIRRRIANRLADRALAAIGSGNRSRASSLLRQAGTYPTTYQLTRARASYRAAKERAAQRAEAQRAAAAQRREAAAAAKAAQEAEKDSCDPNYEGACLNPDSPDYDCEGGSGDGPDYTGPVRVVGSDPFDLDRDGDGSACE